MKEEAERKSGWSMDTISFFLSRYQFLILEIMDEPNPEELSTRICLIAKMYVKL